MLRSVLASALVLLAGCATLDTSRPIEKGQGFWWGTGQQDGHILEAFRCAGPFEPRVTRQRLDDLSQRSSWWYRATRPGSSEETTRSGPSRHGR